MARISWSSEPFPPKGAITAEGIRNQLGRPRLDLLTILVRESAQNSWDARLRDRVEPVDYAIDMWTVGPAHAAAWRELLSQGALIDDHLPIRRSLRHPTIRVLSVSDRGTSGLCGPTRADRVVSGDRDFVSFVFNIGEPRNTELGGGTYGFGKGVFYLMSHTGTILLYTRCTTDTGYETRLMGCTLWQSYSAEESGEKKNYTGRHWWGDTSGEVVEPLVGAEADAMAQRLGLRLFKAGETGTTIVVIDPNLDGREPAEAASYLAETIAWHLWPKMLESSGNGPAMRFSVTCAGVDYPVPDPREMRPLNLFVAAYEAMEGPSGKVLESYRPKKLLGKLGLVKRPAPALEATAASRMVEIEDAVHHVCLMRPAELVVAYRPGPKPPSEFQHYAGVFRADADLDDVFAKAEPPTHDAWNPQSLESPANTYVRVTLRRIDDALNGLLNLESSPRGGSARVALGAASTMFSPLIGGAWGTGGATDYGRPGGAATPPPLIPVTDDTENDLSQPRTGTGGPAENTHGTPPSTDPTPQSGASAGRPRAEGDIPPHNSTSTVGTKPSPPRRRPRVEYIGDPYHGERFGVPVLIQEFRLPVQGAQRMRIGLAVAVTGAGGREIDPPVGAVMPTMIGWESADGSLHRTQSYVAAGGDDSVWRAIVRPAPDTVTEITVTVEAVQTS